MTIDEYLTKNVDILKNYLDKISRITNSKTLNKPSMRFLKSHIIDTNLTSVLNSLTYVDEFGYDAVYNGLKISIKSEKKIFQKRNGGTSSITMANLNGINTKKKIKTIEFDYLLLISTEQKGVALVKRSNVEMVKYKSQIKTQISKDKLKFIITPNFNIKKEIVSDNLEEKIKEIYNKACLDILNLV